MSIHPSAVVDKQAEIDPAAEIGPYAVIEGPVQIAAGVKVYPHAYVCGWTRIGEGCEIHIGAVIGHLPQDRAFTGERSYCEIGRGTVLREYVTVHRGTTPESKTVVGENCLLFANAHIAHNCTIGDGVLVMNSALLAGHIRVGGGAVLSGNAVFHQFARIGELAMIGGGAEVAVDVPPYLMVYGRNQLNGVNRVGMLRAKMPRAEIDEIRLAYRLLYRSGKPVSRVIPQLAETLVTPAGRRFVEFLQEEHKRPLIRARDRRGSDGDSADE